MPIRCRFALVAALVLAATPLAAKELTPIRFTLDWKFEGPSAPFVAAIDQGFFEEEGVEVTIDTGSGSREAIPRVATGAYQMGFGDINALVKFLADQPDAAITAIFMVYDKPPFAVIGRKELGITDDPKSLEGKKLGAPPPDAAFGQWNAFVRAAGIDTSNITIESVGFPVREPMLAQGDVDAIFGYSFSSVLNLKAQGVPTDDIVPILMADNGLLLYGNAVMVNTDWAKAHPEAVKGFVKGLLKGIQFTLNDAEDAIKSVMSRNEIANEGTELERLTMAINDNILTEAVEADGFGGVDMDRLTASIEQLKDSYDLPTPPAASRVFDAQYLPPQAERMPE